jgi:hypothetical protein
MGININVWKQCMILIFEYRCLLGMLTGKVVMDLEDEEEPEDFDSKNREVVMPILLSIIVLVLLHLRSGLMLPQLCTNLLNLNCKHKHTKMPNFNTAEHKITI